VGNPIGPFDPYTPSMNGDAEGEIVPARSGEAGLFPGARTRQSPRAEQPGVRAHARDAERVDDRVLVARMAAADERAVQDLVARHGDALYALARSMLGEHADAEEVCADAFLQAWRTARTFDPSRGSVIAWLATMVRSRSLDRLRARRQHGLKLQRVAEPVLHGGGEAVTPPEEAPDRKAEGVEARALVARALADLPEAQRSVIELAYFSGLSQSEIAAQLGVPLGTVKTRTLTALRRLRALLGPLLREGVV
jgi:RNA polymerase sigma-70 factor (ECF subfamily)